MLGGRTKKKIVPALRSELSLDNEAEPGKVPFAAASGGVLTRKAFIQPKLITFGSMKVLTQGRAGSGNDASSMQMMMM